jgi:hypothetical protein
LQKLALCYTAPHQSCLRFCFNTWFSSDVFCC